MEILVTVELGPKTTALLANGFAAPQTATLVSNPVAEEKAKAQTKAPKADAKPKAADFDDLDDDAKLEAIKTEVTKHTKKGKSADIKALLTHFDAGRASELAPEQYGDFYNAILRYGKGESVAAITGGGDDDLS